MRVRWLAALALIAPMHCAPCHRTQRSANNSSSSGHVGFHTLVVDGAGKIEPWAPIGRIPELAWQGLLSFPDQPDTGLPTWMTSSRFDPKTLGGINWPNNPSGLDAMLAESALDWYAFSCDRRPIDLVRAAFDRLLEHGTTPRDGSWSHVPFSSAMPGATEYRGADDREFCDETGACGRGDGVGALEPDKVGEVGHALLLFYEHTGEVKYRDAAIDCARALAAHVREGDEYHSPWPFRVYAKDDAVRDEYSGHVLGAIRLFDELERLQFPSDDAEARASFAHARTLAIQWMLAFPMKNDVWGGYFEDIPIYEDPADNPNQYAPLQTARWLIEHRGTGVGAGAEGVDPAWREHVEHIFDFVEQTFAQDADESPGKFLGADLLSEQRADMAKMSSHTARWGALHALWFEATGDEAAKETAWRALAWASYWITDRGLVKVGPDDREGWWFSDGYGDYIRHFIVAMGAVPEWAPPHEDRLLRSSSVVTNVVRRVGAIEITTFDPAGDEVFRLAHLPKSVTLDGRALERVEDRKNEGFVIEPLEGDLVLRVRRERGRTLIVSW
jgi:hypothetical protein